MPFFVWKKENGKYSPQAIEDNFAYDLNGKLKKFAFSVRITSELFRKPLDELVKLFPKPEDTDD